MEQVNLAGNFTEELRSQMQCRIALKKIGTLFLDSPGDRRITFSSSRTFREPSMSERLPSDAAGRRVCYADKKALEAFDRAGAMPGRRAIKPR